MSAGDDVFDAEFTSGAEIAHMAAPLVRVGSAREQLDILADRAEIMLKMRETGLAVLRTNPRLFTAYPQNGGGHTYRITKGGAERVMRLFGLERGAPLYDGEITGRYDGRDDDGNAVARYQAQCSVRVGSDTAGWVTEIGYANSEEGLDRNKPLSARVENNVRMKALAGAVVRGVSAIMGLGGITDEEMVKVGIDVGNIPSVEFKKGGGNAASGGGADASEKAMELRDSIQNLLDQIGVNSKADQDALTSELGSYEKDGETVKSPASRIKSEKWLAGIEKRVVYIVDNATKEGLSGLDAVRTLVPAARKVR